jgi:hypothetical protein
MVKKTSRPYPSIFWIMDETGKTSGIRVSVFILVHQPDTLKDPGPNAAL